MKDWYGDASTLVAAFGVIVLATVAAGLLFGALGWLGIALFGVLGLLLASHLKLSGGRALHGGDLGADSVAMVARQMAAETEGRSPTQRRAEAERQRLRARILNLISLAFAALAALGAVMVVLG
ncbi:MAG: hypothetical protein H6907_21030 [Hyphomicrobiales bacterium]|nr:hypothetical protein [Hyphomicrobiales bacterium]